MTDVQRLTFSRWFQGLAMSALALIALWVGNRIQSLDESVKRLSEQVATLNTKADWSQSEVRDLKDRVRALESKR